jgi:uncharacterized protein
VLRFEWDERKNEINRSKHGFSFETAKLVFGDPHCLLVRDRTEASEERWHAIGTVLNTAVAMTVVHTYPSYGGDEVVRIVSARRATKREEQDYAESL